MRLPCLNRTASQRLDPHWMRDTTCCTPQAHPSASTHLSALARPSPEAGDLAGPGHTCEVARGCWRGGSSDTSTRSAAGETPSHRGQTAARPGPSLGTAPAPDPWPGPQHLQAGWHYVHLAWGHRSTCLPSPMAQGRWGQEGTVQWGLGAPSPHRPLIWGPFPTAEDPTHLDQGAGGRAWATAPVQSWHCSRDTGSKEAAQGRQGTDRRPGSTMGYVQHTALMPVCDFLCRSWGWSLRTPRAEPGPHRGPRGSI